MCLVTVRDVYMLLTDVFHGWLSLVAVLVVAVDGCCWWCWCFDDDCCCLCFSCEGENQNYLLNYSIGGISIEGMYGESVTTNYSSFDDVQLLTQDNWTNCLLHKLGFDYENLFPTYGERQTTVKSIYKIQPYDTKN